MKKTDNNLLASIKKHAEDNKIVTEIFTNADFKGLKEWQKSKLALNYRACKNILLETETNKLWKYAKRKSIEEISNEPNFYLVKADDPTSFLHIFCDETFLDCNLLSKNEIKMLYKMQNYLNDNWSLFFRGQ